MSVSVYSTNITNPFSGYSYFFDVLYNCDVYPVVSPHLDRLNTAYQFPSFTSFSNHSNYNKIRNYDNIQASQWLKESWADNSGNNSRILNNSMEEKSNIDSLKSSSSSKGSTNEENIQSKSKIWRPFSPPPSSEESDIEKSNVIQNKNTRDCSRNTFFSIKPSNVKIGASKTSVFKAVKKNTFACTQCSSRYLSNRQLNSHMRVHTGSKPFRCEYPNCFKSFARNEELTRHKRIHSGFKPHLCTICKKRFGRKDHLSKHLKTHLQTSEKKVYQCPFTGCGHRYTRSDALTRHKSTAHAIKNQK